MKFYIITALIWIAYDFWQGRTVRAEYKAIKSLNAFCHKFPNHVIQKWTRRDEREALEEKLYGKIRANRVSMLFDLVWPVYIVAFAYSWLWEVIYKIEDYNDQRSTDKHMNIDHHAIREEHGRVK